MPIIFHARLIAAAAIFVSSAAWGQTAPVTAVQPSTDAAARGWDFDAEDTPHDTSFHYGVLSNGMKYAIKRNATPKGSAVIRFRIDMGSTAEADDQRGLAHFIEHMAFNGSTHVPEGEMVKLLQRDGLAFGADTNASTTYTETTYKLDLPRTDDKLIDTGLMLMRETASGLTFSPAAIDRERGVILSEMRLRDKFGLRRFLSLITLLAPRSPVAVRNVIGTQAVIQAAPAARMRDLYDRFYTPARATLVIVGDIDPSVIEAKIKARFSDWKPRGRFDGDPATSKIDTRRPVDAAYFVDPAVPVSVSIATVKAFERKRDTPEIRRQTTLEQIGAAILSRRLARISQMPDAPILAGSASGGDILRTVRLSSIDIVAKDDDWRPALFTAEQELRRALAHGFLKTEVDEQVAGYRTAFENEAAQAPTRASAGIANTVLFAVEHGASVTTPEWRLAWLRAFAPEITPAAVNAAFRARWANVNPLVHISAKTVLPDAPKQILQIFGESGKIVMLPPAEKAAVAFAYTDFGTPGKIAFDSRITDLDLRTVRFANNVRLTIKQTDFEKDIVRISLRVGSGALEFNKDKPGLAAAMGAVFATGGLQKHSFDELRTILAGKSVTVGFSVGDSSFGSKIATTPRDFNLQMQLLAAYLTAPGFRPEADQYWQRAVPLIGPSLEASPASVLERDAARIVADGDPRFGIPDVTTLKARNMAELRAATARAFASGSIEIGIVGEIDEARVIETVAKTFGALPARDASPLPFADARVVRFAHDLTPVTLRHAGKADEAQIVRYWPTTDDSDAKTDVELNMLSNVMKLMLTEEIRERLGATYSASAGSQTSSIYPGYGYLSAGSNVDVARLAEVDVAIDRVAKRLREIPVSADLLVRARNPVLERLTKRLRENWTWLDVTEDAQTEPRFVARFRAERTLYEAVTPMRLQALAKRFLVPNKALTIRVVPKAAP